MLWNGSACSYDSSVFSFLRNIRIVLYSGCTSLQPHDGVGGVFCTPIGATLSTSSAHASPVPCCVGHGGRWEHLHRGNWQVLTDEGLSQASWLLNIPHCVTDCLLCVKYERQCLAHSAQHTAPSACSVTAVVAVTAGQRGAQRTQAWASLTASYGSILEPQDLGGHGQRAG